ncbi:hypothetical protein [Roseibium sp.]|uniref:tetratricopeptide repeat protein n=1 Tax=Roseibium sp. TaxID=1936156 RepID=UPI003A9731D3
MAKNTSSVKPWKIGLVAALFGSAGLVTLVQETPAKVVQSGPLDPTIEEQINQARGLQKLGRWQAAAEILSGLAKDGHPIALYHLGRAYKNGRGVEKDLDQARIIFMEAARFSFAYRGETAYELGRLFQRSSGEYCARIALEWFHKALSWDYPKAHVQLAKHYERAIGIERDLDKAFHHYEQAAIAGYPSSTINFARILMEGRYGSVADPAQARFWATKAMEGLSQKARDGSASAAKTLGRIYRDGEFVETNHDQAEEWFVRSAKLGDAGSMHDLALMKLTLAKAQDDVEAALEWLRLAAEADHGGALTALARLHLKQEHGLQSAAAVDLLKRGVAVGHAGAMEELSRIYAAGVLVERNLTKAIELAEKGADRGHIGSTSLLEDLRASIPATDDREASKLPSTNDKTEG